MRLSHLNWASIGFGSVAGLFTSLLLFAASFSLGGHTAVQVVIQFIGFFVAGLIAGRFALVDPSLSGGMASLILFFGITVVTVGGTDINVVGLVVLGTISALIGTAAGSVGQASRNN